MISSCCGFNFSTSNTWLIFAIVAAILFSLSKWHLKGVKWLVQSFRALRVNFAWMKFDWFICKQGNVASLNHGLERKLVDSNPWFAMMMAPINSFYYKYFQSIMIIKIMVNLYAYAIILQILESVWSSNTKTS